MWNHNLHYHPMLLDAVPRDCGRALDVGCGEGALTRELAALSRHVVGIDLDEVSLHRARQAHRPANVDYVRGDVLDHQFVPSSFDAVVSVAVLHHMDARQGLERMRDLLRPGGVLALVGLARSRHPVDLAADAAGTVAARALRVTQTYTEVSAPMVWPPPLTYRQIRRIAATVLPGVRYRRHTLFRHSLVWTKPVALSP